jgi:hypothetical protein
MEDPVNIVIRPREHARFIYRVRLTGHDETGHVLTVEGDLACW